MLTNGIQKLLDAGQAELHNFTGTGGQFVIDCPEGRAIIITKIKIHAFADLPNGTNFETKNFITNSRYFRHCLIVKTKGKRIDRFHAVHELHYSLDTSTNLGYTLPHGYTDFDTFLKHEKSVIFELFHAPDGRDYGLITGRLNQKYPSDLTPFGYGNDPAGFATVQNMQIVAAQFETRPMGKLSPTQPATPNSDTSFYYPIIGLTRLNPPRTNLDAFSVYTIPIIDVQYVLVNKSTNATY